MLLLFCFLFSLNKFDLVLNKLFECNFNFVFEVFFLMFVKVGVIIVSNKLWIVFVLLIFFVWE